MSAPTSHQEELSRIAGELDVIASEGRPVLPSQLDPLLLRLKAVPPSTNPSEFVELLTNIAGQFYSHGQNTSKALEPISLAVLLAEQYGLKSQLRRALSVQGLIRSNSRNAPGALSSLSRALNLAEELGQQDAVASAWVNIAVTLFEVTLYTEARAVYERGLALAPEITAPFAVQIQTRALFGIAECCRYLQDNQQGVEACKRGIEILKAVLPSARPALHDGGNDQIESLFESSYAHLLLALNQPAEAESHARRAQELALASGAHRAMKVAAGAAGLVEVHLGRAAEGLARIIEARDSSKGLISAQVEMMLCSVQAYERAGQPDLALRAYRELMTEISRARLVNLGDRAPLGSNGSLRPVGNDEDQSAAALQELSKRVRLLLDLVPSPSAGQAGLAKH